MPKPDLHLCFFRYSKGVLKQRNSECLTQVVKQNESNNRKDKSNDKIVENEKVSSKKNNTEVNVVESEEEFEPIEVSPIESVVIGANRGELNTLEKR